MGWAVGISWRGGFPKTVAVGRTCALFGCTVLALEFFLFCPSIASRIAFRRTSAPLQQAWSASLSVSEPSESLWRRRVPVSIISFFLANSCCFFPNKVRRRAPTSIHSMLPLAATRPWDEWLVVPRVWNNTGEMLSSLILLMMWKNSFRMFSSSSDNQTWRLWLDASELPKVIWGNIQHLSPWTRAATKGSPEMCQALKNSTAINWVKGVSTFAHCCGGQDMTRLLEPDQNPWWTQWKDARAPEKAELFCLWNTTAYCRLEKALTHGLPQSALTGRLDTNFPELWSSMEPGRLKGSETFKIPCGNTWHSSRFETWTLNVSWVQLKNLGNLSFFRSPKHGNFVRSMWAAPTM